MTSNLRTWLISLCTLTSLLAVASAATPLNSFEVVAVTPSRVIKHEVDLKGPFDDNAFENLLTGPRRFSHAVGFEQKAVQERKSCLNWYQILEPSTEPRRTLTVRDALRANGAYQITIGRSAFLLSPAQRLTTGSPSPIPDTLNYFKAYEILDAPSINQKVKLSGTFGPAERTATKAVFLCVPVEEWHHDEHFPVKNSQDYLVVYELLPHKHTAKIATIDQFGLNELEARSSNWLCVHATSSEPQPKDAR